METAYVAYILYSCSLGKYYSGQTNDLEKRLQQHNSGHGKYTKHGAPWDLIWFKKCLSRSEAVNIETQIKKRGAKRYIEDNQFGV